MKSNLIVYKGYPNHMGSLRAVSILWGKTSRLVPFDRDGHMSNAIEYHWGESASNQDIAASILYDFLGDSSSAKTYAPFLHDKFTYNLQKMQPWQLDGMQLETILDGVTINDDHRNEVAKNLGLKPYQVTSKMRANQKAVSFGLMYGMSPKTLGSIGLNLQSQSNLADRLKEELSEAIKRGEGPFIMGPHGDVLIGERAVRQSKGRSHRRKA